MDYREEIQRYLPATEQEQAEKEAVLSLMESFPDSLLTRDNTVAHFTASAVILTPQRDRTLMIFHNLYQSWSWDRRPCRRRSGFAGGGRTGGPGGDRDCRANPCLPADALSGHPSGLGALEEGAFCSQSSAPFCCLWICSGRGSAVRSLPEENSAAAWLPVQQLEEYVSEPQMLPIYRKIMNRF